MVVMVPVVVGVGLKSLGERGDLRALVESGYVCFGGRGYYCRVFAVAVVIVVVASVIVVVMMFVAAASAVGMWLVVMVVVAA